MRQPMRPVRYNVAASLDGFIADVDGKYDWIPLEPAIDFGALFRDVDTVLLGRHSFELVLRDPAAATVPLLPAAHSRTPLILQNVERFPSGRSACTMPSPRPARPDAPLCGVPASTLRKSLCR